MKDALLEFFRRKKRLLGAIVALFILTLILFVAVDSYQKPEIAEAQQKWSELRKRASVGRFRDASAIYKKNEADLEKLKERIPSKRMFPQLLGEILEQAASNGVSTGKITYKPLAIEEEKLLAYELSMGVSGGYASVKSFLTDLLKKRELIVVDNVSWINSDAFEENVTMDLRMTIYLKGDS